MVSREITSDSGNNLVNIEIVDNDKFNQTALNLPPKALQPGSYQICLRVTLDKSAFPTEEHISRQKCTFVSVILSEIVARILPDQLDAIFRGTEQDQQLNAWDNSVDPNLKDGEVKVKAFQSEIRLMRVCYDFLEIH